MGLVDDSDSECGLDGSLEFFREYLRSVESISSLSLRESYILIIVMGLYLYSKYYRCGIKKGSSYSIVAGTISSLFLGLDRDISEYVISIVVARNSAVHKSFVKSTNKEVLLVLGQSKLLLRLLRIEKIVDKYGNFIEPESGKYEAVNSREDAISYITRRLAEINEEDKNNTVVTIESAVNIMSR